MDRTLAAAYRAVAAALLGAQLFFAAIAAPSAFPREVAALSPGDFLRTQAADLVGRELASLDRLTLAATALCALFAIVLARRGAARARRAALPVLLAGLCALVSSAHVTPRIHALRAAGQSATPAFALAHKVSTVLLAAELCLLLWAVIAAPRPLANEARRP